MIIPISDFSAPQLDLFARYRETDLMHIYEPDPGLFLAESPNVIIRALDAGYTPMALLIEDRYIDTQAKNILTRCPNIPAYTAPFSVLQKLTGYSLTRGALCIMRRKPPADFTQICQKSHRIAVLEHIVNPTNVGAIFRSAAALHMDAVVLTKGCSDPLYRRCIRVSMGTVFQIPWAFCPQPEGQKVVTALKNYGYRTVAMALCPDSISISDPALKQAHKLAVYLGTEGVGLLPETITACDDTVRIPMSHGVDSLNVAAASAVTFWELSQSGQ